MVARIKSGKSIKGMLLYNEDKVTKGDARLILASGFAADVRVMNTMQKLQRFQQRTMLNAAVGTNAIHITLNFDPSEKLADAKLQRIAADYMERIGFSEQPFLVYRHMDAAHSHIHIATTNIRADGGRIDIHNLGRTKSEEARRALEKQYGLVVAEGRGNGHALGISPAYIEGAEYGKSETKRTITNIVNAVANRYSFTSLPEFNAVLRQFNVVAERGAEDTEMFRKKGLQYSITDKHGKKLGVPIKASIIYGKPTLVNLEKKFQKGVEKRKPFREPLKRAIDRVLVRYDWISRDTLVSELAKAHIGIIFRENEQGMLYGITYVDNLHGMVFNGSSLGKSYSAKAISEKLSSVDKSLLAKKERGEGLSYSKLLKPKGATGQLLKPAKAIVAPESKGLGIVKGLLAKTYEDAPTIRRKRKKPPQQSQEQQQNL